MSTNQLSFVHIINPFSVYPGSQEFFSQQLTFITMRNARLFADKKPVVQLASAQFSQDRDMIPPDFMKTRDLERSILDYGTFQPPKKLPFLIDILTHAHAEFDADYVIYTNTDIHLQPHFYRLLPELIAGGPCSFTITRRTLIHPYHRYADLPRMYLDPGEPHRGWDCFIFPREFIPHLYLKEVCLGAPLVGLALFANLQALDASFRQFRSLLLTFHLGNDRSWSSLKWRDYLRHNQKQLLEILNTLERRHGQFHPVSPPGKYLRYHRNPWLGKIFDALTTRIHIPARFTRRKP